MEFFATLNSRVTQLELQQQLRVETLSHFCASIYEVVKHGDEQGEISTVWGLFEVRRECIRGGLRFSLPDCLNAVVWTVTTSSDEVTVHCTISRREQDADFIESLEDFVEDWRKGLGEHLHLATDVNEAHCAKHA